MEDFFLYFFSSLWSDDMDIDTIEVFENSHLGCTDQKRGTDKKLILIERLLLTCYLTTPIYWNKVR